MNIETAPRASQEPTDKRYPASGTNVGAPSEHELDIVNPNEIYIVDAPDKLDVIGQQILSPPNPEQAMLCLVYAEIVIEAIQNILESELAGLLDNTEGKNRLARQVLLNEAGLPGPLPLIFTSDKSGLLRQLYYESLDRVDSIYHDDELDVSQKQAALGEIADVMNKLQVSMMILAKEEITHRKIPMKDFSRF